MAFPELLRPSGLRFLLGPRLPRNQNGFQGAHVIGSSFWDRSVNWLDDLGFPNNENTLNNGILLPESERGNAVLGAANHIGNHFGAFDRLFYDVLDLTKLDGQRKFDESNLYFNVIERDRSQLVKAAEIQFIDNPAALAIRQAEIDHTYRIHVRAVSS